MDVTDNIDDVISESNFTKHGLPEITEEVTSQNAENAVEEIPPNNANANDIPIDDADEERHVLPLKPDIRDVSIPVPSQESGDGIEDNYLKVCVKTDAVITSTNISPEISSINKSLMEYLDTAINDNDVKSNIDDDNNSDVLDEELQLRWDDDENDGDNVIGSADEEELLQEKSDTFEIGMEGTNNEECEKDLSEGKLDGLTSSATEDIKDVSLDSIQRIEEIVTQHGLKKPDMMLEIPTQELMDFMDEDDEPDLSNFDISPDIQKSEDSPKGADVDSNEVKTGPVCTELESDNIQIETTKILQETEEIISAEESEANEKNEPKVSTEILAKDLDINSFKPEDSDKQENVEKIVDEPQPSTSKSSTITEMRRDSDEVGEMNDSLGLLAESTRVVEDDEEQEDDDDGEADDDGEDDEEYDPDEENSNQMTVEYSEDSNALNSDLDTAKAVPQTEEQVPQTELPVNDEQQTCEFTITDVISQDDNNKNIEATVQMASDVTMGEAEDNTEEIGEETIQDKEAETVELETAQSPATVNVNTGENDSSKLPEETEQEDVNSTTIKDVQCSSVPDSETKKDDNVVLLESSSEDEKENTSTIEPEIVESGKDVIENSASPNKENSKDINIEKMDTDKIVSPKKDKKQTSKVPIGLEVFNVDSDEDEMLQKMIMEPDKIETPATIKCVNPACQSPNDTKLYAAEADVLKFYEMEHKKKAAVCEDCANVFDKHLQDLLNRFKNFTPLLDLHTGKCNQDLVEIYDSESEDEEENKEDGDKEKIGTTVAKFLEDNLADVFNTSWEKYKMDSRLTASENELQQELNNLQVQTKEIDKMLKECQAATDKLRNNLYATFEVDRKTLPAISIVDTPTTTYCSYEEVQTTQVEPPQTRLKRRLMTNNDTPAKRLAVSTPDKNTTAPDAVDDDNVDVSVVKLSREAGPADLPPPGEITKPPLRAGLSVYAMKTTFGLWVKAKIIEVLPRTIDDDGGVVTESKSNTEIKQYNTISSDPPKVSRRLRKKDKNVPKIKKIPKTGAERIRAYRERILAYEREMASRSKKETMDSQTLENKQMTASVNENSILYSALTKTVEEEKPDPCRIEVDISPYPFHSTIQSDTKEVEIKVINVAKTTSEQPLTYGERRTSINIEKNVSQTTHTLPSHNVKLSSVESSNIASTSKFTSCRVKYVYKVIKNVTKHVTGRCLAYADPPDVRLIIGTRIIACAEKTDSFYSGVVAEVPNPVNKFRYLVFFDDGHAKYVQHADTRLVCECSQLVWEEVHPYSQEFVRQYLLSYPERPMVRLRPKQHLKTEWQGQWWNSRVLQVDASLAEILLAGKRREWIYRGSTRLAPLYLELQAAERHRARPMPRSGPQVKSNMPYVEYTRYDEPSKSPTQTAQQNEEMRRQRAVAKKSTALSQPPPQPPTNKVSMENILSRVVHYKPKNAVRPLRMVPHECGPHCRRTDVLPLKDLRTYNPLTKPLLSGWERQLVRYKANKIVMYRAPCGRRLRDMRELHRYLRAVRSDMAVDLFDFSPATHCLAEFVLNNCIVGKKDLSHGKENVPVPCVNYHDESLPEFCSYNTERTPTAGVPLNLDPDFLCGCDCDDDCEDKTKCACWKMTLEGARTIGMEGDVGYVYRRLPDPLPSGIYECNSRCKCSSTCLNRVAQHPLQLKLQVFKTEQRGWGIRALNDVPKGAFLCVYAGNLLTDATANLDGLNEGDEYLAELDYIEVVEAMKEGYEEDIPDALKENDQKSGSNDSSEEEEESSEEDEESKTKPSKDEDDDFRPSYVDVPLEFNKRLRTREKRKKEEQDDEDKGKEKEKEREVEKEEKKEVKKDTDNENGDEDCITISDDEEVREPSRFTVQAGMDSKQLVSKYRSVRSYFGKDEACYIMDAKVQGNIGRYLNHSCCPNVFVQNVFVDTHDPRFPWVAFFASTHIRAGVELTWNYNYDVGSVPGKVLYCYCGADNCRGRLL